jgi:hypothetical protein
MQVLDLLDPQEVQDHLVHQEVQEHLVQQEHLVLQVRQVLQDSLMQVLDHQVHQDRLD